MAPPTGVKRPLIGIPGTSYHPSGRPPGFRCHLAYAQAVADAGGAPLCIPLVEGERNLFHIYEHLNGLLLTGGPDVNPRRYGEDPVPQCGEPDDAMDWVELRLVRWALEDDLPLLAVCRGQQVLNVTAGGSLYQDLPSQLPGSLDHQRPGQRDQVVHQVAIAPDTKLAGIVGAGNLGVNSTHHQAVRDLAPLLVATARAPDGVIEGVEGPRHRFVVGVQWHPEELYRQDLRHAALFHELVRQASR